MSFLVCGIEIPKNCEECDLSRIRHSSLGDIIDCKYIGTVGSAFKDPYNILNTRHPKCPLIEIEFNEKQFNTVQNMLSER